MRHDDRYPNDILAHEWVLQLQTPNGDSDADTKVVMQINHDTLEIFGRKIPLQMLSGGSQSGRSFSPNGQFCWNYQDDGSVVMYDTHGSVDETTWTAKWAQRPNGQFESF